MMNYIRCFSTLALVAVFVSASQADLVQFNVTLDGLQEVPANASPGIGTATVVFDDLTGVMSITGSYSGLVGTVVDAHLHGYAPIGANAGVIFGLSQTGGTAGSFSGGGVIPAGDIANVMNGLSYINIHSTTFPGGEIRGQLINPVPEPGSLLLFAIGLGGSVLLRRRSR
jgi:hypothetical protein